jgi:pyruvate/2-oxoglutarate dehydrogenase complex dihydrolipoamide acyltransferase (E2) component
MVNQRDSTAVNEFLQKVVANPTTTFTPNSTTPTDITVVAASTPPMQPKTEIKATPRVRKLAQEFGIALESVVPTGSGGCITEEDVRKLASTETQRAAGPKVRERLVLSGVRKAMASHLVASWHAIPHFHQIDQTNAGPEGGQEKAARRALRRFALVQND